MIKMRRKKKFKMISGFYFFNIKMGYQNTILISRKNREEAEYAFENYLKQKKESEWLGQWDGEKFIDDQYNDAA